MARANIPVHFDGFEIGEAMISDRNDGIIVIDLNDTPVAQEIRERLQATDLKSISFKPRI